MKTKMILGMCLVLAFLASCGSSSNDKENFQLGTLEIVDHGPALATSWETHIVVDSTGKIISTQYTVQEGVVTGSTSSWEYDMSAADKSLVEQESTAADILYRGDFILEALVPCTEAGDLVFHAVSKSGKENQFLISAVARCNPSDVLPQVQDVITLYSTITGWEHAYPAN